jgi:hypothetical protein
MKIEAALVKERGVAFAVVIVEPYVLDDKNEAARMISTLKTRVQDFSGIPVVLMAENSRGIPSYYGRTDIVQFLSRVPVGNIPWAECTMS